MYIYLSKWPTLEEHLGCFHILPILNNTMITHRTLIFTHFTWSTPEIEIEAAGTQTGSHLTCTLQSEDQEETTRTVGSKVPTHSTLLLNGCLALVSSSLSLCLLLWSFFSLPYFNSVFNSELIWIHLMIEI